MNSRKELRTLAWIVSGFLVAFFLPVHHPKFGTAVIAAFDLLRWYAREHVVLCLLPAFLIAGAISVFVSQGSVIKYFGAKAKKWVAYTIASVSGSILAVCSCTILPLFSSIYKKGAGLGPAIAFLYSGPAINILAIILTARILGIEMGIARTVGAITFSILIGLIMAFIYRKEEKIKSEEQMNFPDIKESRPLWHTAVHFFSLVFILIFINWGKPTTLNTSVWYFIWSIKWYIAGAFGIILAYSLYKVLKIKGWHVLTGMVITLLSVFVFQNSLVSVSISVIAISIMALMQNTDSSDGKEWIIASYDFAKQIIPLLALGVLIAGFLLGSTHDQTALSGIIPNAWVAWAVGGNSLMANLIASVVGAFMYFATLTEVPIVQGLLSAGMGKGPALALLLAGPSLSLPNMLVIRNVLGTQKTVIYVLTVIVLSTLAGILFGNL